MTDERWRTGYDAWKTTPPDDDGLCDPDDLEQCEEEVRVLRDTLHDVGDALATVLEHLKSLAERCKAA